MKIMATNMCARTNWQLEIKILIPSWFCPQRALLGIRLAWYAKLTQSMYKKWGNSEKCQKQPLQSSLVRCATLEGGWCCWCPAWGLGMWGTELASSCRAYSIPGKHPAFQRPFPILIWLEQPQHLGLFSTSKCLYPSPLSSPTQTIHSGFREEFAPRMFKH